MRTSDEQVAKVLKTGHVGIPPLYMKAEGVEGYSRVDITLFVKENNRIMSKVVLAGESVGMALRRVGKTISDVHKVIICYDDYERIVTPRIATYTNHLYHALDKSSSISTGLIFGNKIYTICSCSIEVTNGDKNVVVHSSYATHPAEK